MPLDPYRNIHIKATPIIKALARHIYETTRTTYPNIWIGRGWDSKSAEHATGRALDIIVSKSVGKRPTTTEFQAGQAVAAWLVKHAKTLNIRHIIWNKRIYRTRYGNWGALPGRTPSSSVSDWHIDHIHVWLENTSGTIPAEHIGRAVVKPAPATVRPFSINNVLRAIQTKRYDGNTTTVQGILKAKGLYKGKIDGIFGRLTLEAYAAWQRSLGYTGKDANGVPGKASLSKLLAGRYYIV